MVTEFEQVIEEIKTDERNHEQTKKERINKAAQILIKNGWEPEKVSTKIAAELKGYVTGDYICRVLSPELKRAYEKKEEIEAPKQVMNADGTIAEAETTGDSGTGDNNTIPTGLTKNQLARQQYEQNKYKLNNKAIKEIKASKGRALPDQEQEQEQEENTATAPEITTIVLTPVRFKVVEELMKQDKNIYLDFNPDTYRVTKAYIKDKED